MDVAKYIGLFLLKNNSCYIHGLGNLEYRRKPATFDGNNLIPASYEVAVAASGSIDDALSNFIATNEQISISKATSALKDFSTKAKAELALGNHVAIPSLGSFEEVNGKLLFNTVPYLQQVNTPIAAEKSIPKRVVEEKRPSVQPSDAGSYIPPDQAVTNIDNPYEYAAGINERKSLNWGRIILFVLILLAIIAGIGFALKNIIKPGAGMYSETAAKLNVPAPDTIVSQMPAADTVVEESSVTVGADGTVAFKVILNTYETQRKADKRYQQLTRNGNIVELKAEDSSTYFILMNVQAPPSDTARVIDSLRRTFNPDGVYLY